MLPPLPEVMLWHTRQSLGGWEEHSTGQQEQLRLEGDCPCPRGGREQSHWTPSPPASTWELLFLGLILSSLAALQGGEQNSELGRTSGGLSPGSCSKQGSRASPCPENPLLSRACPRLHHPPVEVFSQVQPSVSHYPWAPVLPPAMSPAPS